MTFLENHSGFIFLSITPGLLFDHDIIRLFLLILKICPFMNSSILYLIYHSTGWGQTSGINPFPPNALQWAQIPIQTSENCQDVYQGSTITDGMICAGDNQQTVCNVSYKSHNLAHRVF